MTAATDSHRALVNARRKRSTVWRVIHFFGSLKFALLLLSTIAIACALATVYESRFDTKTAQALVYKAWWFPLWLGLLCLNLFAVTLTRWPWQRKHLGFVITHYGIITLLAGALIGSKFGFEGNVTLHRGEPPLDRITVNRSVVRIENPTTGARTSIAFDPGISRPSERHPREIAVPGTSLKILADAVSKNLITEQRLLPSPDGRPGIDIEFTTKMMGQHVARPFILDPNGRGRLQDFFGLAKIAFTPELPRREPLEVEESQVVFARVAPVIETRGAGTGVHIGLSADGQTVAVTLPDGKSAEYSRAEIENRPQQLGDATFTLVAYWPDFVIKNGRPQSASMLPNNPAVVVQLTAPPVSSDGKTSPPLLEIAPTPQGIAFQLSRGGLLESAGTAKIGEPFALGWADWTATVTRSLPRAQIVSERHPGPEGESGVPGFRVRLVAPDGKTGAPQWIAPGDAVKLTAGNEFVRLAYGLEQRPIPFTIALKKFEVPRLEGTDEPANFIASVEFRNSKTGMTRNGVAEMNHPASWPGDAFAVTTGLNYKFSQASWTPEDLDQTTLQVLYDPGWFFKWTGSLAICAGIFIMFYLRPKKS